MLRPFGGNPCLLLDGICMTNFAAPRKRMTTYFGFATLRVQLCCAAAAALLLVPAVRWMLDDGARRSVIQQARLCAAALVPAENSDIGSAFQDLSLRYDRLRAIGTLDAEGKLIALHPPKEDVQQAAVRFLNQGEVVGDTGIFNESPAGPLWGAVVPLTGCDTPLARRVLILLAQEPARSAWAAAAMIFAPILMAGSLAAFIAQKRWFARWIARPLRSLAPIACADKLDRLPELETGGWAELENIAEAVRGLQRLLSENESRRRRIEHAAEQRISDHQMGFDRKLQRAMDRASSDPLTQLRNRTFLSDHFEPIVRQHCESGDDLSIVMIDVDNFKTHNDTLGHAAGDEVLRFIGDLLRGSLRPADHAIRYGGDEFLLVLPGTCAVQASLVADRLVKLFAQFAASHKSATKVAISAGVASLRQSGAATGKALMRHADAALYEVKRAGKNGVFAHPPMTPAAAPSDAQALTTSH